MSNSLEGVKSYTGFCISYKRQDWSEVQWCIIADNGEYDYSTNMPNGKYDLVNKLYGSLGSEQNIVHRLGMRNNMLVYPVGNEFFIKMDNAITVIDGKFDYQQTIKSISDLLIASNDLDNDGDYRSYFVETLEYDENMNAYILKCGT